MREIYVFPPGLRATCPNLHPLPESMHFLPQGVIKCSAMIKGGKLCGALVWCWSQASGICIVVPITESERDEIATKRMNDIRAVLFLGLTPHA